MLQGLRINSVISSIFAAAARALTSASDFCHDRSEIHYQRSQTNLDIEWIEARLAEKNCTLADITNIVKTGKNDRGYTIAFEARDRTHWIMSSERPQGILGSQDYNMEQLSNFLGFPVYESKLHKGMKLAANPDIYKPIIRFCAETDNYCTHLMAGAYESGDDIPIKGSVENVRKDFARFSQRQTFLAREAPTRTLVAVPNTAELHPKPATNALA